MNVLYPLRRAVERHASVCAVADGERRLTWREFGELVQRGASALAGLGLERGDRVGVLMSNRPEYLELYFSTAQAGLIIVPLNTRWNTSDMVFSLSDAGAKALIVDEAFSTAAASIGVEMPELRIIGNYPALRQTSEPRAGWPEPAPDEVAGLFYTSGTTGGPKGVMLTHRNLHAHLMYLLAENLCSEHEVYLHAAPMFHLADVGFLFALTNQGGTHCFLPSFAPEACLNLIERYRVETIVLVPTMINMVVNHPNFDRYDTRSLKRVSYGASPMPVPLLELAMKRFNCTFLQAYGMTEMSPVMTILRFEDHRLENLDSPFTPVKSAGKPMMGVEVRVVDELDRDVPVGTPGEIIGRGETMMKGYWNRPEVNREVLRGGWMHTGDMGAFDEQGFLYILDRKKDMIKTGGENVYSPEVESLVVSHPAVLECAIIGVPDPKWGESIRAAVVLRPGAELDEAALIGWCRERLTHFKCPSSVVFLDQLPKGGSGKVQKNALRQQFGGERAAASRN